MVGRVRFSRRTPRSTLSGEPAGWTSLGVGGVSRWSSACRARRVRVTLPVAQQITDRLSGLATSSPCCEAGGKVKHRRIDSRSILTANVALSPLSSGSAWRPPQRTAGRATPRSN